MWPMHLLPSSLFHTVTLCCLVIGLYSFFLCCLFSLLFSSAISSPLTSHLPFSSPHRCDPHGKWSATLLSSVTSQPARTSLTYRLFLMMLKTNLPASAAMLATRGKITLHLQCFCYCCFGCFWCVLIAFLIIFLLLPRFVVFESEEAAMETALYLSNQKFQDKPVRCRIKPETMFRGSSYPPQGMPVMPQQWQGDPAMMGGNGAYYPNMGGYGQQYAPYPYNQPMIPSGYSGPGMQQQWQQQPYGNNPSPTNNPNGPHQGERRQRGVPRGSGDRPQNTTPKGDRKDRSEGERGIFSKHVNNKKKTTTHFRHQKPPSTNLYTL